MAGGGRFHDFFIYGVWGSNVTDVWFVGTTIRHN
jgi:hypothetical protein